MIDLNSKKGKVKRSLPALLFLLFALATAKTGIAQKPAVSAHLVTVTGSVKDTTDRKSVV